MKLTLPQPVLSAAISAALPAVASRSTLPVLGNLLLSAQDGMLRVSATNLEITLQVWCEAEVETAGAVTIPAQLFTSFVKQLPSQDVTLTLNSKIQTLSLSCGGYSAKFKGLDAAEFPVVQSFAESQGAQFDLTDLSWIAQVIFAASDDGSRPTLTGIEMVAQHGRLTAAATDGYRLCLRTLDLECEPFNLIIPSGSLRQLAKFATAEPVSCTVPESRNQILFALVPSDKYLTRVEMASQLIDARFPDYKAIIPKHSDRRTKIDVGELRRAVNIARLFARDDSDIVQFALNGEWLTISATSVQMGDSQTRIEIEPLSGKEPLEIHFNGGYLLEYLAVVEDAVILETTQATRPGLFRVNGDDHYTHVLMPMQPPRK